METNAVTPSFVGPRALHQTIDASGSKVPPDGVFMRWTERDVHVGKALDTPAFSSVTDAIAAARDISAGSMPGVAVTDSADGFRLHAARTYSSTWQATSPGGTLPPNTVRTARSNVPFAMGNLRFDQDPPRLSGDGVVALVDADRVLVRQP